MPSEVGPDVAGLRALIERLRDRVKLEEACGNRTDNPRNHVKLMDEASVALPALLDERQVLLDRIEALEAGLRECDDKLWVARCNSNDPSFRKAADYAHGMARRALLGDDA